MIYGISNDTLTLRGEGPGRSNKMENNHKKLWLIVLAFIAGMVYRMFLDGLYSHAPWWSVLIDGIACAILLAAIIVKFLSKN